MNALYIFFFGALCFALGFWVCTWLIRGNPDDNGDEL